MLTKVLGLVAACLLCALSHKMSVSEDGSVVNEGEEEANVNADGFMEAEAAVDTEAKSSVDMIAEDLTQVIVDGSGDASLDTVAANLQGAYVEKVAAMKLISLLEAELSHAAHLAEAKKHEALLARKPKMPVPKCYRVVAHACCNGYNDGGQKPMKLALKALLDATKREKPGTVQYTADPLDGGWKITEIYKEEAGFIAHNQNQQGWPAFAQLRNIHCKEDFRAGRGASMPDCAATTKSDKMLDWQAVNHPANTNCWAEAADTDCNKGWFSNK